ncbi:MAG: hypothetical protein Q4D45_13000 [Lachnospiraceae bacterium]|nr:hypothetical protein [Lachnospiraceae bacterium]
MKLITDINDDVEFLRQLYMVVDKVKSCISETGIMDIRKRVPQFTGEETEEEQLKKLNEQAKKNIMDMAKRLMIEKPQAAISLFQSLCILEENEEYPKGFALLAVALKCLENKEVMDFFMSLMSLENAN